MIMNPKLFRPLFAVLVTVLLLGVSASSLHAQEGNASSGSWVKTDTVKAGKFDTGRMWTFDFPPKDYFQTEYKFPVTDEWLNKVRMSALRFKNYCSASFVSEDGLVMTNHHCARESVTDVTKEGEDLHENGFWAPTLDDERKVPGLYVDQLVKIIDVTADVQAAIDGGANDKEKADKKAAKIKELENNLKNAEGLEGQVITFFNGGKYSLYGFKRYKDVRLVFAPETQLGFFGGDPDNFTYPRYALDCSFFRVYDESGKPLKTSNYYKWSVNGAAEGEPVFVVGNPGRTTRQNTLAQLEYQRDISLPLNLATLKGLESIYSEMINEFPEKKAEMQDQLFSFANSRKANEGILKGLRDPYLMAKKKDFEKTFKAEVAKKPELQAKYGNLWSAIEETRATMRSIAFENAAYQINPFSTNQYLLMAKAVVDYAMAMAQPEDQRDKKYKGDELKKTLENMWIAKLEPALQKKMLRNNINFWTLTLGADNSLVQKFTGGKSGNEAADYALSQSQITSKEKLEAFLKKDPQEILKSSDPFIYFITSTQEKSRMYMAKAKEIQTKEADYIQALGRALFAVYGTSIPPDATFSLRISDGVVKGYDYNGTTAPAFTTFFGLYDRYYSFKKEFPFNLPAKWQTPPADFDLSTPMVFVATNDIIGGNSGSPVINKNAEVVGLAFDGNIESLPGQFIFDTTANRTVSVHSAGMYEAIKDLYKATRLADELKAGKIK